MSNRPSAKELESAKEALAAFIAAAEAFRDERDDPQLERQVTHAAGRASYTADLAGHRLTESIPGRGRITYNPISNWNSAIDPFQDQLLVALDAAYYINGVLERMHQEAYAEERSLVGRIARFVGLAGRVRKYLADRGHSTGLQRTVTLAVIVIQFLIGVVASLMATGLALRLWPQ